MYPMIWFFAGFAVGLAVAITGFVLIVARSAFFEDDVVAIDEHGNEHRREQPWKGRK